MKVLIADTASAVDTGRRVLRDESAAIHRAADALDDRFDTAVHRLCHTTGRIVLSGLGKSGLVARKIAATLTATGTPAMFVHPTDGLHGDLGLVGPEDTAILISRSGEGEELPALLAVLARHRVTVIAITGAPNSRLGTAADVTLDAGVPAEACPHGLTPTTSTAVASALGDALVVAVLEAKGFTAEDFALHHPGGSLGRRLQLRAGDLMIAPGGRVSSHETMRQVVPVLAHHRGLALVVEGTSDMLEGVVTAGDLSRIAESTPEFLAIPVASVMTRTPHVAHREDRAATVLATMERAGIMAMPVLQDGGRVTGVIHLHDLLRAGVG